MEKHDTNRKIDVEKIHEILFDGCDMKEPISLGSFSGQLNEVPEEDVLFKSLFIVINSIS